MSAITKPTRTFAAKPAVRERVPLLIGLAGPSGSGKTFSALRLAKGIQAVTGGDIFGIDTESKRMLHYADYFKFRHVEFAAPFGSLDYLVALQQCVGQGANIIIVDSLSHEHEGPGGMLDFQEQEVQRMAGDDWQKRERVKMAAWIKPKAARRQLINGILQLNANFIFCFRAKSASKPVKGKTGKIEIEAQGFEPISGEELVFEMTVNCLLLPHSKGVPTWQSDNPGEKKAMKLPEQFKGIFADNRPLDEGIGKALADWAGGGKVNAPEEDKLLQVGEGAAKQGLQALEFWWKSLPGPEKKRLNAHKDRLKKIAEQVQKPEVSDGLHSPNDVANKAQLDKINGLFEVQKFTPEQKQSLLQSLGIAALESATAEQADQVIINLEETSFD